MRAVVLAHQGGWDEILLVLAPVSLFAALLWLANKRAASLPDRDGPSPDGPGPDGAGPGADDARASEDGGDADTDGPA